MFLIDTKTPHSAWWVTLIIHCVNSGRALPTLVRMEKIFKKINRYTILVYIFFITVVFNVNMNVCNGNSGLKLIKFCEL